MMEYLHPNLDRGEIEKFDTLASDWWNPTGALKTLHVINPVRLRYISNRVSLKGKSVLDIGCGGGLLSEAMALAGANVTGIDPSETSIDVARRHQQNLPIDYHVGSIEDFAETGNKKFDIVTCMELLEHLPDPAALPAVIAKLLNPGGHLFMATINRSLFSYVTAVLAVEYVFRLLPRGTHDYAKFIRPAELCGWLRQNGFAVRDISGMGYIPGADVAFLTNRVSVNYLIHAQLGDW
jgi:2-polyprenyl-6-hydroxyphenyl methylase/3-demethylubiquinone-9 3-methyltransferase